jgi:hypothetical protein
MRALGLLTAALLAAAALAASDARADNMDPALGRLTIDDACRTTVNGAGQYYDPTSQFRRCQPNDAAFAKLVAQLGTAIAPIASHAARTTGFGGYRFGLQAAYTTIDSGADYWKRGTQGPIDESTKRASVVNNEPDDVLQLYTIYLAKGFPFGVELGGAFGYLANTEIISGGGDVRIAIFEGFRDSIPGYIPDIGVGGQVRTMTGTSEIKLTVASIDAEISKPIPIAGTLTLQPHVGYQLLWIFGDSGLIDLTPNTDPLALCDYQGDNNPATPDPDKTNPTNPDPNALDGQPVCNGSSADFNNNVVFNRIRLNRHRINFGVQLRFQMLQFGVHVLTDIVSPVAANPRDGNLFDQDNTHIEDATDPSDPSGRTKFVGLHRLDDDPRTEGDDAVERQWTIALELGAIF